MLFSTSVKPCVYNNIRDVNVIISGAYNNGTFKRALQKLKQIRMHKYIQYNLAVEAVSNLQRRIARK